MKNIKLLFIFLIISGSVFAQGELPTEGLMHLFKFDDASNLEKAEVGNDLIQSSLDGVTPLFQAVAGSGANDGAVEVGLGSFYRLNLDFEPNGSDSATRVNEFTFVIDLYLPQTGVWYGIHASDNDGDPTESDFDSFIRPEGRLGVGSTGYSYYRMLPEQWYRLVITADLGTFYQYFLDGQLAQDGSPRAIDDRFSLPSINEANQVLLFGDNDGEDANIYISQLAVYNRPMLPDEIWSLGGFGHPISTERAAGTWLFDSPEELQLATFGSDLVISGNVQATAGPEGSDGAVNVPQGSYLAAAHNIVSNGEEGTRVNIYTILMDVKIDALGTKYSLLQTDPANANDADLIIDEQGRIGSADLGFFSEPLIPGDWYRVALVADLGNYVTLFVDGDSVLAGGAQDLDGRFSLASREDENSVLFFADDNGEDGSIQSAKIVLYNRALSSTEVLAQGGFEHGDPNTEVTGSRKTVHFNGDNSNNKFGVVQKVNDDFNFGDGDFTIEVWTKPDLVYPSDPALISDKAWTSGGNPGWVISIRGDDWKFNAADTNRNRYDVSGPKVNDGNWHHLVVIAKEDSGLKLITDNLESVWAGGEDFVKCGNLDSELPLYIAQDGTGKYPDGPPAPAQIDEIRIWKGVAIDPQVIFEWRSKSLDQSHPHYNNLVGYWKFDEVNNNVVEDMSGRGNHMELSGNPKHVISYAAIGDEEIVNSNFNNDIMAMWGAARNASSGGLSTSATFPYESVTSDIILSKTLGTEYITNDKEDNPYVVMGHNGLSNLSQAEIPAGIEARLNRAWMIDVTETLPTEVSISFDFSKLGASGNAGSAQNYVLLRKLENGAFSDVTGASILVDGDVVTFENVELTNAIYTLGSKNLTESPLGGFTVDVESETLIIPKDFALRNNYPNPFNPSTKIQFELPVSAQVKLSIFNVLGQEVSVLVNEILPAGYHFVDWNSNNELSSGVYVYRIEANGNNGKKFVESKKMMLIK